MSKNSVLFVVSRCRVSNRVGTIGSLLQVEGLGILCLAWEADVAWLGNTDKFGKEYRTYCTECQSIGATDSKARLIQLHPFPKPSNYKYSSHRLNSKNQGGSCACGNRSLRAVCGIGMRSWTLGHPRQAF